MKGRLKKYTNLLSMLSIIGMMTLVITLFYINHVVNAFDQVFASHIYIENLPVGGMAPQQVYSLLEQQIQMQLNKQLMTLKSPQTVISLSLTELNPSYPIAEILKSAFEEGHEGNWMQRYKAAKDTSIPRKDYRIIPRYDEASIAVALKEYAQKFAVEPVNALIVRENRKFKITPEINGEALDTFATAKKIHTGLLKEQETYEVEVVLKSVKAKQTQEDLKLIQSPIASFSTAYNDSDQNRNQNLRVAAKKINSVLAPEEIFSLGVQLEPISQSQGYRTSKVIVNGKLEEGIGGGVCQIASTLYNAVLLTNLDIVGRANHSLPVAYVPLGRDATYASGAIDFKFQNNSTYPVFIESYCENNRVYVNIFSHTSLKPQYDEIMFTSELIESIDPPETKYIKDSEIEMGKMVTEVTPLEGKTVKLYKLYYKDGQLINKELVNTSYYKARGEVIKIGTKPLTMQYQY